VWPVMLAAVCCEALCKPFGIEPPLYRRRLDFFIKDRAFSGDKARTEIGFEPSFSLHEGFLKTADWYFAEGLLRGKAPVPASDASTPAEA